MAETQKRLRIHGRVQGVFYRAWISEIARALGLKGWVRNRTDQTVELLVQGEAAAVARLIERCREGPPAARVAAVDIEEAREEVPAGFEQRPTV